MKEIAIDKIYPYALNAKEHPKKQIKQIADSIKVFGFNQPIVVDKNDIIIVGHGRYEAAKLLELKKVPVIKLNISEEKAKAYRLADNKLNESEWDMGLVIDELKGLSAEMLDLTGFDKDLLIEPDEKDDVIPEKVPARSKLGDLYELGSHRLLCGDSTQPEAVLRLIDGKKADMVFTDPQYGVSIGKKNRLLNSVQPSGRNLTDISDDDLSPESLYEQLLPAFKNIRMVMDDSCTVFVTAPQGGGLGMMMMMMMRDADLLVRHVLIWKKNRATFSLGKLDYDYAHEPILLTWGKKHNYYGGGSQRTSVWEFPNPMQSKLHPTMKPICLIENALLNNSKRNDIVIDLYGGSGSTLIACQKTNRICYMQELDPHYCDVIIQRYMDYTGQTEIKKNGKVITWQKSEEKQSSRPK